MGRVQDDLSLYVYPILGGARYRTVFGEKLGGVDMNVLFARCARAVIPV